MSDFLRSELLHNLWREAKVVVLMAPHAIFCLFVQLTGVFSSSLKQSIITAKRYFNSFYGEKVSLYKILILFRKQVHKYGMEGDSQAAKYVPQDGQYLYTWFYFSRKYEK